jgi:hypothetical protein
VSVCTCVCTCTIDTTWPGAVRDATLDLCGLCVRGNHWTPGGSFGGRT